MHKMSTGSKASVALQSLTAQLGKKRSLHGNGLEGHLDDWTWIATAPPGRRGEPNRQTAEKAMQHPWKRHRHNPSHTHRQQIPPKHSTLKEESC